MSEPEERPYAGAQEEQNEEVIQGAEEAQEEISEQQEEGEAKVKQSNPQVTPTWVDTEDGMILVNTAEGRLKQKNMSRDPTIAISVVDQNNPYHMVTVRGRVIQQTNEGADEHVDELAKKYLGVDKYPLRLPNEKRIIIKIKPQRVHYQPPPN